MKDLVVYPDSKERQLRLMRYEEYLRTRRIKHYIAYSPIGDTIIGKWASRALIGVSRLFVRSKYGVYIFLSNLYRNRWKYGFQSTLIVAAIYTYHNEQDHFHEIFQKQMAVIESTWMDSQEKDGPYLKRVAFKAEEEKEDFLADFDDDKVQAYIKRFSRVATTEMEKYGIPASIKVSIAILESKAGENEESSKRHNHFGKSMTGPAYQSAWENWRAHTLMLKDQYPELFYLEPNSQQWAIGLEKLNYSEDPGFAQKLLEVIDRYELNYLNKI